MVVGIGLRASILWSLTECMFLSFVVFVIGRGITGGGFWSGCGGGFVGYSEFDMDDFEHRIALLNVSRGWTAAMLVMVLEGLPKDASLVRVQDSDYRNSHLLYFESCKFKVVPEGHTMVEIRPVFYKDGENQTISLVSIDWPIDVDFPALKRA